MSMTMKRIISVFLVLTLALAFMTGTFRADTFLPPGKVADFFGFQYMRDIDAKEAGHNMMFLTDIGNNGLAVLDAKQEALLLALARVKTYGAIVKPLTASQKTAMAKLKFGDSGTWPGLPDQYDKRTMTHGQDVLYMTYASEFFSWYSGSETADVILKEADRLDRLVKDLASIAIFGKAGSSFAPEEGDILETVDGAVARFVIPAGEKGVTVSVDGQGPIQARFDHDRIVQVMDKLLSNAIRHTPSCGIVAARLPRGMGIVRG